MLLIFLSSGLFLGWSLGANDAANVFGTAVGSKMLKFSRAALICSVFVIIGAVVGGSGTAHTLGKLGAVDAIGGAFMVALAAGATVTVMTRLSLPVSTSQAIVGAIVGWNMFSGSVTDIGSLIKIVSTWIICPILSAVIAMILFGLVGIFFRRVKMHILYQDMFTRWGLIFVGAFGAYSLGANNIANVMGVFVPVSPIPALQLPGGLVIPGAQLLFLIGGLAIALGVYTYSQRVMATVGSGLFKLNPQAALVVVLAQALVLFIFSSRPLEAWLIGHGLPPIPLVPVSSSQAVVGAVIGIGLLKGGRNIRFNVLGETASGWVTTPIISGVLAFVALFFLQNVFSVQVYRPAVYHIDQAVVERITDQGMDPMGIDVMLGRDYSSALNVCTQLKAATGLDYRERCRVAQDARVLDIRVSDATIDREFSSGWLSVKQKKALQLMSGRNYTRDWLLISALENLEPEWKLKPDEPQNKLYNARLEEKRDAVRRAFIVE
jgi:inorganic phosphate transporter, PiT family